MKKVDRSLKTNNPRMGQEKRLKESKSNITDNESGKIMDVGKSTLDKWVRKLKSEVALTG